MKYHLRIYTYILYDILTLIPYLATEDVEKRKMTGSKARSRGSIRSIDSDTVNWDLWFSTDRTTTIILSLPLSL